MAKRGRRKYRKCTIGKGKVWDGIKNFFKKTKILSTAANLIPGVGGALGNVISNVGYGRRRRHRRGGMVNPFAKKGGMGAPKEFCNNNEDKNYVTVKSKGLSYKLPTWKLNYKKHGSGRKKRRRSSSKISSNLDNRYIDNKIRVL